MILNNNFEYKIHKVNKDINGRYIIYDLEIIGVARFLMVNIYGPNKDNPEFFNSLFDILSKDGIRNWIITGDWNLVMDQKIDTWNYKCSNNPNSTKVIQQQVKRYNLIDIWRQNHPKDHKYTWFRKNPNKAARLDFFLISSSILNIYQDSDIKIKYRSDHCKIGLSLFQDKSERGKGLWKLNSNLLKDSTLSSQIRDEIALMIAVHACTPYNPDFVKNYRLEFPELMITIKLFWEVLLTKLRGTIIAYASKSKKLKTQRELKLIK